MKVAALTILCCISLAGQGSGQSAESGSGSLADRAKPYLEKARATGSAFVTVSAASGLPNLSADSLVSAFGSNLAPRTEIGVAPFPTSLGGISLQVVDSAGIIRLAQLLYVSPTQIDYLIPAGTAAGTATMNIADGTGSVLSSTGQIQRVAPGLFTANANGQGVIAATAYRMVDLVRPAPVTLFQCGDAPGTCVSVPIDVGVDAPVYVTLYTTGLRGRSDDSEVSVTIAGQRVLVRSITSEDDSTGLAGIDEVVIGIPISLRGTGEADLVVSAGTATSNAGRINIQ